MAKKVKSVSPSSRPAPKQSGAAPREKSSSGMMAARLMGCVCLAIFIFSDQLWLGTAACGVCMTIFFGLQVFVEKSRAWYLSGNFYGAIMCYVLAYVEYQYGIITKLIGA